MTEPAKGWRTKASKLAGEAAPAIVPVTDECRLLLEYLRTEEVVEVRHLSGRTKIPLAELLELLTQAHAAGAVRLYAARVAK